MMIKYKITTERLNSSEHGAYTSCSIAVYDGKTIIRKISDISTSKWEIRKLCRLCNKLSLDPIHIDDVIEDMLCV